jgi:site-specific recombinase XerD
MKVTGPLASYAAGFRRYLGEQGLCLAATRRHVDLMAHLSSWLAWHDLGVGELTPAVVKRVLAVRRATGRHLVSVRGAAPVLGYLRGLGVAPEPVTPFADTSRERVLASYRSFLAGERGLVESTIEHHMRVAAAFLAGVGDPVDQRLRELSAGQVLEITSGQLRGCATGTAQYRAGCARVLLRFLFVEGRVPADLAPVVPTVASWKLTSLPRRLDATAVAAVVDGCDRDTQGGRREYAIVLMLARLGLRVAEVAALTLDDIDWRAGEITIRGKGGRSDKLPLMGEVGEALADYLRAGRPQCATRAVFVTLYAPRRALTASAVRGVIYHACAQVGVEPAGPHRLRHTLASDLLAAGSSLHEIGQVLRHQDIATTAIYAKVDRKALAVLARPWPIQRQGGAR